MSVDNGFASEKSKSKGHAILDMDDDRKYQDGTDRIFEFRQEEESENSKKKNRNRLQSCFNIYVRAIS